MARHSKKIGRCSHKCAGKGGKMARKKCMKYCMRRGRK